MRKSYVKTRYDDAPRFRKKTTGYLNRVFCRNIRKKHSCLSDYTDRQIKDIVNSFGTLVQDKVIKHREGVELPEQLGCIFIGKFKRIKNIPNYKASQEKKKMINYNNTISDNYGCKIFYVTKYLKYQIRNIDLFGMTIAQTFKKKVGAVFDNQWQMYATIDSSLPLSKQLKMNFAITLNEIKTQKVLETYNEFEI